MKIVYYLPDLRNPFWKEIVQGVKDKASDRNYTVQVFSADDNSENQLTQLSAYKTENPNAVLISPVEVGKITHICKEIMQNNIPIVAIDQHMVTNVHSSIISGNLNGGILAAQFIGDSIRGVCSIVHIKAPQGYENAAMRRKSFVNEVKRRNLTIVAEIEGGSSREISKSEMLQFLGQNIPFNAIFAENDVMALGAVDALKQTVHSPWPIIVGFDGIPEAIDSIERGEMTATVKQKPIEMGEKSVEMIDKIRFGQPFNDLLNISTNIVTKSRI